MDSDYYLDFENELYYYEQGRGHYSYDQPYEDVDDGELDYMGYHWSKDTLDKWNKVMRLTGNERFVHDGGGWDEGDVNEPMNSLSNDLWDQVSRDILVELGYGIGEHRQQEMEKYLNDEVLFDEDMYNQMVEIKLSWVQVLWIIGWSDSKNFSDMLDFEWNRVENDLSDVYFYRGNAMQHKVFRTYNFQEHNVDCRYNEQVGTLSILHRTLEHIS